MLKLRYDPHTHTDYSHGTSTIAEMVEQAAKLKLTELHITEHGNMHHYARKLTLASYREMKAEITRLQALYPQIKLVFGIEANIVSVEGELDFTPAEMEIFDEVNMGFHMLCRMKKLSDYLRIQLPAILFTKLKLRIFEPSLRRTCTKAALSALSRYKINMITHPQSNYPLDIDAIAEKCAQTDTLLEINDPRGCLNAENLARAAKYPVTFALGSDAHCTEEIGRCERGAEIIEKSGIDIARVVNICRKE